MRTNKMNTAPLVSIITPCFNAELYIKQTICSVLDQSYSNIEYIIVDGESTDSTMDIIRSFGSSISKVISEPDRGMYDAINKGIKHSSGDIVCYLNSDDVFLPNTIMNVVAFFRDNSSANIVFGRLNYINEEGRVLKSFWYPKFNKRHFRALNFSSIPQPSTFWRRNVHDTCGEFNANLEMCGDYEFFIRVSENFRFFRDNKIVVNHRRHRDTLTNTSPEVSKIEFQRVKAFYQRKSIFLGLEVILSMTIGFITFKLVNFYFRYAKAD